MNSLPKRSTRLECEALEDRVTPATLTWLGAVDGLWSQPGNWSTTDATHPVPQAGDALVFPAIAGNLTQTDDLAALTLSTITFQGGSGYQISDNNGITLTGGIGPTGIPTAGIALEGDATNDSIGIAIFDISAHGGQIQPSSLASSHLTISQLIVNGPSSSLASFDIFPEPFVSAPQVSTVSIGSMQVNGGSIYIELDDATLDVLPSGVLQLPHSAQLNLANNGHVVVERGAVFNDFGPTTIGSQSDMYVAGTVMVGPGAGTGQSGQVKVSEGLLFVEPTGQLYLAGTLQVGDNRVFPETGAITKLGGELYTAGLVVVESGSTLYIEHQTASCVVAPGGQLYDIGLLITVDSGQFYAYGLTQIIGLGAAGLYVYDGILNVQPGGALYAYGLVAIEPNTAFYDYGLFALEPSGYLYDAGLFVVEPGGVFYDFGPFVAPGGTYYNFGQQIGWGP